ncbi:hypothetical protein D9758_013579 [Tetrapyrgos nigripes]|uniref:Uncharacterized protein n=1 Tax=Tetrapyrgos nigripes TaxID=182062 RepID=A0A8H5CES1_9AGAR|nr:hypothetical protein D9758_013579 [Tetrapyrgos nigripes]
MASTIYLKGYALCNPPLSQAHFLLEADSSENLLQLNKKVQAKTKLSRSEFTFYKALGINIWPKENLPERVNGWLDHNLEEALDPMYAGQIQTIWTDNDMEYDNMLHFIAVDENALADLQLIHALSDPALYARVLDIQEHASTLNGFEQFPPPSQGAASPQDVHTRANGIRAGRPATYHGPSNALFDRHLAILSDKLRNLEIVHPTTDMLDFANRLVDTCAKFYETENAREQPVFQLLNEHFPNARHQQSITNNRAKPEAFWFLALIWELKNEQGNGGNVVVRAAIDYAKILADNNLSGHIRDRSNCPCVLLTLAGTDLNISTAISTDAVYIDTLYLQHLRGSFDRETLVLSVARAMQALKETFKKLSNFYAAMEANPAQSPRDGSYLFPNPVHAGRHDENLLETLGLRFLHKLSRNEEMFGNSRKQREENMSYTVYVALSSGNCESVPAGQVVVKFAQRYNLDAHELLAGADLAPKLYYHCPVLGVTL